MEATAGGGLKHRPRRRCHSCWSGNYLRYLANGQLGKKFRRVQEKKVKKVSHMNVNSSKAMGNCPVVGSCMSSAKSYMENGEFNAIPFNDTSVPSLHLPVVRFEEQEAPGSRSFFTEMIASISDIKFAKDGRHILGRDYMTLKMRLIQLYQAKACLPYDR